MRRPRTLPDAVVATKADNYMREQEDRMARTTSPAGHVSIKRLSELTGFDRMTIRSWRDEGCPVISRGARGDDYVLDIRAGWKWCEKRAVEKAASRGSDPEVSFTFMGIRDPAKAADTQFKMMRAAREAKLLVPRAYVTDVVRRVLNQVRAASCRFPTGFAARRVASRPI